MIDIYTFIIERTTIFLDMRPKQTKSPRGIEKINVRKNIRHVPPKPSTN